MLIDEQVRTTRPLKAKTFTEPDVFDLLKEEWNALLHTSTSDDVFLTWEWQSIWWNAYRPGALNIVTIRDEDDKLVGIAPWFLREGVIYTIGCEDVTDYLDVIVHREVAPAVYETLARYLRDNADTIERIQLCNIPAESPTLEGFRTTLEADSFTVAVDQNEVCPVIALPESFEDYFGLLDKKQRHELRRKMRRAMGADEVVDWYVVTPEQDFEAEIDAFLVLMSQSDPEKAAFLADERNLAFFRAVMPLMMANDWLRLFFLTVDGEKAAAYLNFEYNGRMLVYNSGLDMQTYGHLSPGIVLLANIIQYAIEHGYKMFDFLRGDEVYKYYMGAKDTSVYRLSARLAE